MLKVLHHCFLACIVFWQQIYCTFIFIPLPPSPLAACTIFLFLTGCEQFDLHRVLQHTFLPLCCAGGSVASNVWVYSIYHIKNSFSHYFFQYFSMSFLSSPWESLITCLLGWLWYLMGHWFSIYIYWVFLFHFQEFLLLCFQVRYSFLL